LRILLDFRTKPSYPPVIDLVNELSKKFDIFFMPNRMSQPAGLDDNVVCCQNVDICSINPDVVFSTYSTPLVITYLKLYLKLPVINYMFIYMMMADIFSAKFLALPNSYKLREVLKLIAFSFPKSLIMPDKLIVPNIIIKRELVRLGFPKDRIIVLPWGLNINRYRNKNFSPSGNNKDVIVYAGPLHPLRFSVDLLYIFADVIKQNADLHLLLLLRRDLWHQYTYKKLINTITRLNLRKKVSIIMPESHETYLSHVAQASVVFLPYFSSGIVEMPPFTLLECMALSKPIITSYNIATYDIIENGTNGFFIPPDPFLLVDSINSLILDKRKARQIGQKARMTVQKKYNLTYFSSKLSLLLESCRQ